MPVLALPENLELPFVLIAIKARLSCTIHVQTPMGERDKQFVDTLSALLTYMLIYEELNGDKRSCDLFPVIRVN